MSKKISIFNGENYFQSEIIRQLDQDDSDFEVYCTYNHSSLEKAKKRPELIRKVLKKKKPKLLKNYLFNSDIILVDLLANRYAEEDIALICETFTKRKKPDSYKKIILISSLLTWKDTPISRLESLFRRFNVYDQVQFENQFRDLQEISEKTKDEDDDEEPSIEPETPRNLGFPKDQDKAQTEKKQDPKTLKGVKSEMIPTQADIEKQVTQNNMAFKSDQMKNVEQGRLTSRKEPRALLGQLEGPNRDPAGSPRSARARVPDHEPVSLQPPGRPGIRAFEEIGGSSAATGQNVHQHRGGSAECGSRLRRPGAPLEPLFRNGLQQQCTRVQHPVRDGGQSKPAHRNRQADRVRIDESVRNDQEQV